MGRSGLRPYKTVDSCASTVATALFGLELFYGFEDGVADYG
jgi:hypothetical protein